MGAIDAYRMIVWWYKLYSTLQNSRIHVNSVQIPHDSFKSTYWSTVLETFLSFAIPWTWGPASLLIWITYHQYIVQDEYGLWTAQGPTNTDILGHSVCERLERASTNLICSIHTLGPIFLGVHTLQPWCLHECQQPLETRIWPPLTVILLKNAHSKESEQWVSRSANESRIVLWCQWPSRRQKDTRWYSHWWRLIEPSSLELLLILVLVKGIVFQNRNGIRWWKTSSGIRPWRTALSIHPRKGLKGTMILFSIMQVKIHLLPFRGGTHNAHRHHHPT